MVFAKVLSSGSGDHNHLPSTVYVGSSNTSESSLFPQEKIVNNNRSKIVFFMIGILNYK
jgi:hypothetical protein